MHRSAREQPPTGHLTKPKPSRAHKRLLNKIAKRKPNMVCQPDSFIDRRLQIIAINPPKPVFDIKKIAAELRAKSQGKQDLEAAQRKSNSDIINLMKVKSSTVVPPPPPKEIPAKQHFDPSEIMILSDSSDEDDDLLMPCNIRIDALLPHNTSYTCYLPVDLPYRESKKQGQKPSPEKNPPKKSPSPEKEPLGKPDLKHNIPERFQCFVKLERLDVSLGTSLVVEDKQCVDPPECPPMVILPSEKTPHISPVPKEEKKCNESTPKNTETMPSKAEKPCESSSAIDGTVSPEIDFSVHNTDARQRCLSTESSFDIKVIKDLKTSEESTAAPPENDTLPEKETMQKRVPIPKKSPPPLIPIKKSEPPPIVVPVPVPSPPTRPFIKLRNINDLLKSPIRPTVVAANPFEDHPLSNNLAGSSFRPNMTCTRNANQPIPVGYVTIPTQQYYPRPPQYTHRHPGAAPTNQPLNLSTNRSHPVPQQDLMYLQPTQNQMQPNQYLARPMYIPNQMFPIQMQPYSLSRQ